MAKKIKKAVRRRRQTTKLQLYSPPPPAEQEESRNLLSHGLAHIVNKGRVNLPGGVQLLG